MKRAAIIIIPILLILSIAVTVYVVVVQRFELRKKAEENPYKTLFSKRIITDNCLQGPVVEIQAMDTTYDVKTGVQTLNLIARRRPEVNSSTPIEIYLMEAGCAGPIGNPDPNSNQCNFCTVADQVFFNRPEQKYVIPAGISEINISISITKPITQLICGCSQINIHINRVVYEGNIEQTPFEQRNDCSTIGKVVNNKPRQYLYAVGWNGNCTAFGLNSVTSTSLPKQIESNPTLVPISNVEKPVCTALSASPNSGTTPLTVHFVGSGEASMGAIKKFEFNYGDGKNQIIEKNMEKSGSLEIDHTYTLSGSFNASLRIQDNKGFWSEATDKCNVTITTSGGPTITPSF